ncbi:DUF2570 domain-containing protein [Yersinia mollaretii]|uniref:DUF2570 domain-containing protein n=1 Tax=Yersinia mollaretii TaxID=33060 RepID=UPI0011AA7AA2|nr:DUF2570 domain-containing protein [Yersinia mollaretii]
MSIKPLIITVGLLLLVVFCLGGSTRYFQQRAVEHKGQLLPLQAALEQSQTMLARQAFQFQRANTLVATAAAYHTRSKANSEERQIANRNDLKTVLCADRYIPDATAERLYDYTHRLRARALHHSGPPDDALMGATPPRRMTYRQAVLWLDPLLTLLDRANHDRESIRQLSPHHGKT